jgi:hypothetical protein
LKALKPALAGFTAFLKAAMDGKNGPPPRNDLREKTNVETTLPEAL